MKIKKFIYRQEVKEEIRVPAKENAKCTHHIYKPTQRIDPEKGHEYIYCGSTGY